MKSILTSDEKKYLRRTCRYLGSLGMNDGLIEFDSYDYDFDFEDVNWSQITHFANNYSADIPDQLIPILKKIFQYIHDQDLFDGHGMDNVNYSRIEISIDCEKSEIRVESYYSYYEEANSHGWFYSMEDTDLVEELNQVFSAIQEEGINKKILILPYNGSGDSGYLEDTFEKGGQVPGVVEDWCYRILEQNCGGWEINEGSQGQFVFDTKNKTIQLNHTYNEEVNKTDTIWEENFSM